ncbi:transposase [Salinibacter ruber]|uniref:transposase n=1 Tax=Salinibacter ruber TaxID=146919 RepID=UPI003C6DC498
MAYQTNRAVLLCLDVAGSCRRWLTDKQSEWTEGLPPEVNGRGCPCKNHRHKNHRHKNHWHKNHWQIINGIFWVLRSGSSWRDIPKRYGNWRTV